MMLAACGSDESPVTRTIIVTPPVEPPVLDRDFFSELCFAAVDGMVIFRPGFGVIGGSLLDRLESRCSVERSSNTLRVSVSMLAEDPPDMPATDDANPASPLCEPLALEPGEYQIEYDTPRGPSSGTLILEEDAFGFGCFDDERGVNRVTLG